MVTVLIAVTIFCSCSNPSKKITQKEIAMHKNAQCLYEDLLKDKKLKFEAIKKFADSLTLEEKLSQVFLINLESDTKFLPVEWYDSNGTKKTLMPAGYIFFSYNISNDPEKVIAFTRDIKTHAIKQRTIVPFLSVDSEGGYVNRLRNLAGPMPENKRVSHCLDYKKAFEFYDLFAKQFKSLGFDLNLAPVCEVETENNKDFLDGRSYGNADQVLKYGAAAINAYHKNKVGVVLKHFPGNSNTDPHIGLPQIDMTEKEFNEIQTVFNDLASYQAEMILMSHAVVPAFDKTPGDLSKFWINDILVNKMGYQGIVLSDDIFMDALYANGYPPKVAVKMAIEAGINCIMISEKKFGKQMEILKEICLEDPAFMQKVNNSVYKMLEYKAASDLLPLVYHDGQYHIITHLFKGEPPRLDEISPYDDPLFEFNDSRAKAVEFYKQNFFDVDSDEERLTGIKMPEDKRAQ